MSRIDALREQLDALNESIYEPESRMSAAERARRIEERDRVYGELEALEPDNAAG